MAPRRATAKKLRYHLRFQIIPGANAEKDARILAAFCRTHGIEEVVLFFAGEEWNTGLLSRREEDRWFDALKRVKPILDKAGIVSSLNPWMTVLHADRGRRFPGDRRFKPMVSPLGEVSKATASFADPAWRSYICGLYGRFATLGFRVLWVEDDFRYHNHSPLTWGGGFEPEMLERFSRKIGRRVSRDAVVRNILKPGKPHPWRAKWMETWRECQLEVARELAESVARNAPGASRLGLMSSCPTVHSVEGRDWRRLFRALSIRGRVAHRPHFASYSETPGRDEIRATMMLDVQKSFRPPSCETAPEVENFPFTNWNKSDSLTWAQMALSMFHGADALLLDLFPFCGNPADREPEIGALLDRSRPALKWIAARYTERMQTDGVGIPWRQDAQLYVRTRAARFQELDATSFGPGNLMLPFGIPVSARPGKVNAVFGSLAWAFNNDEIRRMLRSGLLLDAVSAEILCKIGFGSEIGLHVRKWLDREESNYSLEATALPDAGVAVGHNFSINLAEAVAVLEPHKGAREWTTAITPEGRRIGPATVAFDNDSGGRVFTFAVSDPARLPLNRHRRALMRSVISFLSRGKFASPTVTGAPWLIPIHLRAGDKHVVVVLNGSPDAAHPVVHLPVTAKAATQATLLRPLAEPAATRLRKVSEHGSVVLESQVPVPYLGFLVAEFQA